MKGAFFFFFLEQISCIFMSTRISGQKTVQLLSEVRKIEKLAEPYEQLH